MQDEMLIEDKNNFLNILNTLDIESSDLCRLIDYLENETDFFTAPASAKYHSNYPGGLLHHSLNVYYMILELNKTHFNGKYSHTTLAVVALFHDLSKVNYYESYTQNRKIYSPNGSKSDNKGKYDFVAFDAYRVKDSTERIISGSHGFNSYMLLSRFLPLSEEQIIAIVNHHAGMDDESKVADMTALMNRYPLLTLLHLADMAATYLIERV